MKQHEQFVREAFAKSDSNSKPKPKKNNKKGKKKCQQIRVHKKTSSQEIYIQNIQKLK